MSARGIAPASVDAAPALPATPGARMVAVAERLHELGRHADARLMHGQAEQARAGGAKQDWFYAGWADWAERTLHALDP